MSPDAGLPALGASRGPLLATGRTAEVFAWGEGRVIKLLRPGLPEGLADAEAAAAELTQRHGLEVPSFHGTVRVDGRPGLVYERVDGPSMIDLLAARPWTVRGIASRFASLHASLHDTDGSGLPDARTQLVAAIERSAPSVARAAALERLGRLESGSAVLHGDLHPGNVIVTADGPRMIDWLTAAAGPPAADIARTLFLVRDSALPPDMPAGRRALAILLRRAFARAYLAAYRRMRRLDIAELRAWRLPILAARLDEGVAGERAHVERLIGDELRHVAAAGGG